MTIYIDSEYKCHVSCGEGCREIETSDFDGKCDAYIEGFMCVPADCTWTRADGRDFSAAVFPFRDYAALLQAQLEYELSLAQSEIEDMRTALEMLGVTDDEEVA